MLTIYVLEGCPYCADAIKLLNKLKVKYKRVLITHINKEKQKKVLGIMTFPHILLKHGHGKNSKDIVIGGYEDLEKVVAICKVMRKAGINPNVVGYFCM